MKKLIFLIIVFIVFLSSLSFAQTNWITANQLTVGWDAVIVLEDGNAIPAGSKVVYEVFTKDWKDSSGTTVQSIGKTEDTIYTVTFAQEGRYFIGVKAIREDVTNNEVLSESVISWSDNPDYVYEQNIFGSRYFLAPGQAKKLNIK